jgi:hypothetical protein
MRPLGEDSEALSVALRLHAGLMRWSRCSQRHNRDRCDSASYLVSELPWGSVPVAFGLALAPGYGQRKYTYNSGNEQSDNDRIGWHVDPLLISTNRGYGIHDRGF